MRSLLIVGFVLLLSNLVSSTVHIKSTCCCGSHCYYFAESNITGGELRADVHPSTVIFNNSHKLDQGYYAIITTPGEMGFLMNNCSLVNVSRTLNASEFVISSSHDDLITKFWTWDPPYTEDFWKFSAGNNGGDSLCDQLYCPWSISNTSSPTPGAAPDMALSKRGLWISKVYTVGLFPIPPQNYTHFLFESGDPSTNCDYYADNPPVNYCGALYAGRAYKDINIRLNISAVNESVDWVDFYNHVKSEYLSSRYLDMLYTTNLAIIHFADNQTLLRQVMPDTNLVYWSVNGPFKYDAVTSEWRLVSYASVALDPSQPNLQIIDNWILQFGEPDPNCVSQSLSSAISSSDLLSSSDLPSSSELPPSLLPPLTVTSQSNEPTPFSSFLSSALFSCSALGSSELPVSMSATLTDNSFSFLQSSIFLSSSSSPSITKNSLSSQSIPPSSTEDPQTKTDSFSVISSMPINTSDVSSTLPTLISSSSLPITPSATFIPKPSTVISSQSSKVPLPTPSTTLTPPTTTKTPVTLFPTITSPTTSAKTKTRSLSAQPTASHSTLVSAAFSISPSILQSLSGSAFSQSGNSKSGSGSKLAQEGSQVKSPVNSRTVVPSRLALVPSNLAASGLPEKSNPPPNSKLDAPPQTPADQLATALAKAENTQATRTNTNGAASSKAPNQIAENKAEIAGAVGTAAGAASGGACVIFLFVLLFYRRRVQQTQNPDKLALIDPDQYAAESETVAQDNPLFLP